MDHPSAELLDYLVGWLLSIHPSCEFTVADGVLLHRDKTDNKPPNPVQNLQLLQDIFIGTVSYHFEKAHPDKMDLFNFQSEISKEDNERARNYFNSMKKECFLARSKDPTVDVPSPAAFQNLQAVVGYFCVFSIGLSKITYSKNGDFFLDVAKKSSGFVWVWVPFQILEKKFFVFSDKNKPPIGPFNLSEMLAEVLWMVNT